MVAGIAVCAVLAWLLAMTTLDQDENAAVRVGGSETS
jgi:hypothetical protein